MGEFFNFSIEMKLVFLAKCIDLCPQGWGFLPAPPQLVFGHITTDIVTKASVAFVVSMDPDVYFKCCISADAKIQASTKHETEVKPIHRTSSSAGFSCQMKTYDFHLLLAFLRSAEECTEGTYQDDDYG